VCHQSSDAASSESKGSEIFKGNVDESEVGKLRPGMELVLTVGAIEGKRFKAVLEYIAPRGVEENGAIQFEIRAAIEEALLLFEGEAVFVEVETTPQTFEKRRVETGLSDGIVIEIVSGLVEKDRVKAKAAQLPGAPRG
jgi:HlyD family secretion protein